MQNSIQISISPRAGIALGAAAVSGVSVLANVSLLGLIPAFWGVVLFSSILSVATQSFRRRWSMHVWAVFGLAGAIAYTLTRNNGMLEFEGAQVGFTMLAVVAAFSAWVADFLEEM